MKLKKLFIILITTIMICLLILGQGLSNAESGTLKVGISKLNPDGKGYSIRDVDEQHATSTAEYLFDLVAYKSNNSTDEIDNSKALYCIKAGFGQSWNSNSDSNWTANKVTYNSYYDMEVEKEILVGNSSSTGLLNGTVGSPDYNINSIKNNYNQILWILDNIYIPGEDTQEDKLALLEAAGIKRKLNGNYNFECYMYEKNQYDYDNIAVLGKDGGYILTNNGPVLDDNGKYIDVLLTDADIEAIQQAAIWYYTNNEDENYKNNNNTGWIYYTVDGESYIELTTYSERGNEGQIRNEQANILYRYLIDSAEANKNLYNDMNTLTKPVKVNTDGLDIIDAGNNNYKTRIKTIEKSNERKLVLGPIKISKINEIPHDISMELTDQNNDKIEEDKYYFSDENGESLGDNKTIKDMVGQDNFYITINLTNGENKIEKVNAKINASYKTTDKKVWLEDKIEEQPIVEVSKREIKDSVILTGQVREFDLALRKTIVGVSDNINSKEIINRNKESAVRTINIDKESLENGTTATYKHRKDPVVVKENDIVRYRITIYNEGEQAGFAKKIVDQLPKGLTLMSGIDTVISKTNNNNRNTYKVSYDTNTLSNTYNQVTLEVEDLSTASSLTAYNGTDLDYEEIELLCRVTTSASDENDKFLTNIAYIAEAYNSEEGKIIKTSNIGLDRDSAPGNNPVNSNSLNAEKLNTTDIGYTGKDILTEEQLKDNTKYYKGEQDDDDFEKIVLLQVEKTTVSGEKIWVDDNNKLQVRPDKVKIGLYRVNTDKTEVLVKTVDVTSESNWRYSFTKLDKYDEIENEIKYVVKELDENNNIRENGQIFSSGKGGKYEVSYDENSYNITNIYKPFDLALFKYIAAISEDAVIQDGEYVTDNKNANGTYLRAPVVTNINNNGTITYREHDKSPLIVENGDYVLYRIRVYNEGQIDGYASEIKDSLPEGLEYVIGTEAELTDPEKEYVTNVNGIWEYESSEDLSVIVTDNLAKGKGTEFGAQEGDNNYRANLLKALNVNEEITNDNPDWLEVEVLCKVTAPNSSKSILVNRAEISEDSDENGEDIKDIDSTPDKWIDGEDDQDIEKIKLQCFDLALRKYIFSVNGKELTGENSRVPVVDVSKLYKKDENDKVLATTAEYKHSKTPVTVSLGDTVVYSIRAYNEGDVDGFASEITDHLPEYLEFVKDSKINEKYGWEVSEDGRTVTTKYLSAAQYKLKGYDPENSDTLDFEEVQIECKIKQSAKTHENITNIAEITEYKYDENIVEKDADSESDSLKDEDKKDFLPEDKDLPTYKDDEKGEYVPGQEDDDDFEKVYIKEFDLALRKFITSVEKENVTSRIPKVSYEDEKITYTHPKDALEVIVGNVVEYTIRVYNEGEISGYASEVTDDIPEYLEYLPEHDTNKEYTWVMYDKDEKETEKVEDAVKIKTTYLSKEAGETRLKENDNNDSVKVNPNLLNAFDATKEISDTNPSYKEVKVAFKVKDPGSSEYIITNYAQISDDEDENGNNVIDKDSTPNEWKDGEDDQDIENIKVQYFDLALLKYVSKVIITENGKETITETGYNGYENPEPVVKVELDRKKLSKITVKYVYSIKITNEGDIAGYATEITDYVPEGLKFYAEDNKDWTDEGNNVISTKALKDTLLQPGESAVVQVTLRWINDKNNLGLKINTAEISEDDNDKDIPDKDSTPDNKKDGEDDIDTAEVILGIKTGKGTTYIMIVLAVLTTLGGGIALIKKFVL